MTLAVLNYPINSKTSEPESGSLAQSLFFDILARADKSYASFLHDFNGPKPYTAHLNGTLQVTTLDQRTFNAFIAGAQGQATIVDAASFFDLAKVKPAGRLALEFVTPTAFSRGSGRFHCLPEPARVFGSLYSQWKRYSPIDLPELDCFCISIHNVNIHTEAHRLRHKGRDFVLHGFVGRVEFVCDGAEEQRRVFTALAKLARFAGVGMRTGMGMGVVKCR